MYNSYELDEYIKFQIDEHIHNEKVRIHNCYQDRLNGLAKIIEQMSKIIADYQKNQPQHIKYTSQELQGPINLKKRKIQEVEQDDVNSGTDSDKTYYEVISDGTVDDESDELTPIDFLFSSEIDSFNTATPDGQIVDFEISFE
ncbi:unnamed protein product [Candida verbasci]|uniref:Uncharacterized protein n=1 Tax=Candida verbasci TaxID=1227364 RepID=A0A9W4TR99_9ASCO|nr:unnamed protein product [Candida verbasci]